jgi:hypothetical protein
MKDSSFSERCPLTHTCMMGDASTSNFEITGGSMPRGRRGSTWFTLSRTSCAAASLVREKRNCTLMLHAPSVLRDESSSTPSMVLMTSSIGFATLVSISSGEAPGSAAFTVMLGMSTFGYWSTPMSRRLIAPTTSRKMFITAARTGRRMQRSASVVRPDGGSVRSVILARPHFRAAPLPRRRR